MNDCIFCKIEKNEIPSERVYEDDGYIAFLDINPISFGHTLVIPRGHHSNIDETPDGVLAGMIALAKKIGLAVVASLGADAYNIHINNGRASGQLVDHVHLHILPRWAGDTNFISTGTSFPVRLMMGSRPGAAAAAIPRGKCQRPQAK